MVIVNNALKPFLKEGSSKIDEQADFELKKPKIGKDLLWVRRMGFIHGLQLDNNIFVNKQVNSESINILKSIVLKRYGKLSLNPMPERLKFSGEHHLVNGFEEPRS